MQRVFSSRKMALDNLQKYADHIQADCCVYHYKYGQSRTDEYIIKRMDEVCDKSSKHIIKVANYTSTKQVKPRKPIEYGEPEKLNPVEGEHYLYELMLMNSQE